MSQADRDAEKWMAANARWQERELYKAKETGDPYYISQHGDVIIEKPTPQKEIKMDALTTEDIICAVLFGLFAVAWCFV